MKVIIIGGVAGGATTAARIRRVDEAAEIILLEKGKYISYANCGLPYYIGGVIEEREKLFVQTPEAFSTRFRVDVRTENEVIFIDRKRKTVTVRRSSLLFRKRLRLVPDTDLLLFPLNVGEQAKPWRNQWGPLPDFPFLQLKLLLLVRAGFLPFRVR